MIAERFDIRIPNLAIVFRRWAANFDADGQRGGADWLAQIALHIESMAGGDVTSLFEQRFRANRRIASIRLQKTGQISRVCAGNFANAGFVAA